MKVIKLEPHGKLRTRDVKHLGGNFSFFEVLRFKGVGSAKMIYISGVREFDLMRKLSTSSDYISIELLKKGLIIRFKKQNSYKATLIRFSEIDKINLEIQEAVGRFRGKDFTLYFTDISIKLNCNEVVLKLPPANYKSGIDFFKKTCMKPFTTFETLPGVIRINDYDIGWVFDIV